MNRPLSGYAKFKASRNDLRDADVSLRLAENELALRGSFGARNDTLQWRLNATRLAALGPEFAGRLTGEGRLAGTLSALALSFQAQADGLKLPGKQSVAGLRVNGELGSGENGVVAATIALSDYRSGELAIDSARLNASGTRLAHAITVSARGAQLAFSAEASGMWKNQAGWSGSVRSLENKGKFAFVLEAPVLLALSPDRFSLSKALLRLPDGKIAIERLTKTRNALETSGTASGIPLARLAALAGMRREQVESTVLLGASWAIDAADTVDANIRVYREAGDLRVTREAVLGVNRLELLLQARQNRLSANLHLAGAQIGRVAFNLNSILSRADGNWRLSPSAPVLAGGSVRTPSLAWVTPLLGQSNFDFDGSLDLTVSANGTLSKPNVSGNIRATKLAFAWIDQGVALANGELLGEFRGDRLLLQRLAFAGGEGTLSAQGAIRISTQAPSLKIDVVADKLLAISRPDRIVVVSGTSSIALEQQRLRLDGELTADRGTIELTRETAPTLSEDIVIVGAPAPESKKDLAYAARIELRLDLGDKFFLKGRGIAAQIGGALRVRSAPGLPLAASGSIRVIKGTYLAYGQELAIERGVLGFTGPIANPGLDILAMRRNQAVEAGVEVRGTVLDPRAKLVSNPNVPDSEKLSWLVLGHGLDNANRREVDVLAAAARTLLSANQAVSLQARMARTFRLDEFRVSDEGGAGLKNTILTLGKRLSSRVFVTYEHGITGASNLLKVRYALSPRWSLQAQTGSARALDLLYTWAFD